MDKLIFINALGQTAEFSPASKYRLVDVEDLGGNTAAVQTVSGPFQDGESPVGGAYFNSKVLKVRMAVVSSTLADDIRALNNRLNPKLGSGQLVYEQDGVQRVLPRVGVRQLPTLPRRDNKYPGLQISAVIFEVYDPLFADYDYTTAEVESGGDGLNFPVNITDAFVFDFLNTEGVTVTNSGDVDCPVEVIFDGPVSAPVAVTNETTGEQIVLGLALLEGERLTITTDTDNTNVIKTDLDTGEETVAFQYLDVAQTTFFKLRTGVNLLKITADGTNVEQATVRFRQRYVGV